MLTTRCWQSQKMLEETPKFIHLAARQGWECHNRPLMIMRWCHLDGLSVNFTQTFLLKNKGFPSKQLSLAHSFLGCSQSHSIKVLCWALLWDRIWNKAGLGCWGSLEFLQYVCDYIFLDIQHYDTLLVFSNLHQICLELESLCIFSKFKLCPGLNCTLRDAQQMTFI